MNKSGIWGVIGLLIAGAAAGIFGYRLLRPAPPAPGISSPAPVADAPVPSRLPALENSDAYAREHAAGLSSSIAFRDFLEGDAILSRLVAAINMAAHGKVPKEILGAFAPSGKFKVKTQNGRVIVDPAGYERYDAAVKFVVSVNAVEAAKFFEDVLPLLDAAQRALGEPQTSAKEALFTASRELLSAPVLEGEIPLKAGKKGIGWAYADEKIENLSPAQKQLIRLGPKNQSLVQLKLRAIVTELGAKP